MAADERFDTWEAAKRYLEDARSALPDADETKLGPYREYLDHDEIGLAFECIVRAAEAQRAAREVWKQLSLAAESMQIGEHDFPHGQFARVVAQHLGDA